jgi:spore coat protein U-like protein
MSAKSFMHRWLRSVVLALCCMGGGSVYACTTYATATIDLGTRTSFEAQTAQLNAGSGGSGLACPGLLTLLTSQYIFLSVDGMSPALTNAATGDTIPYEVITIPGGTPVAPGTTTVNLAANGLLTLLGTGGQALLYVNLGAAPNVSAGTYTATVNLRWHYATCDDIGALGLCVIGWSMSPGITQSCLPLGLTCTLNLSTLPGSGVPVTVTVQLTITPDCRISADDINFGAAPFVESFPTVTGALRVNCTKGSTYSVGLNNGTHYSGARRRMASGSNYLEYDVFHPGGLRWDNAVNRATQSLPAQGDVAEVFTYEARVYTDQTTPPVGIYQDQLVIDVEF